MQPSFSFLDLDPFISIQLGYNLQHNLDITTVEVQEDLQIRKVPVLRDPLSVPRSDRDDLWRKEVLQQHQWMNLWEKTMVVKPKHLGPRGPVSFWDFQIFQSLKQTSYVKKMFQATILCVIVAPKDIHPKLVRSRTWQIHLDHMAIQDLRQCTSATLRSTVMVRGWLKYG